MRSIKYFEKGLYLFENQDYVDSITWLGKALKIDPDHVRSLHIRALAKGKLADYSGAIEDFEKALTLEPSNAIIISDRALVYHFMGEKEKSMADFDKAIMLEPENGYRYASRAFIKDRIGDLHGALEDYNTALALDPEDAISINNKGMVEEKMGYADQARKSFKQADELEAILRSNDIKHASKPDHEKPEPQNSQEIHNPPVPNQQGKSISIQGYFKVLTGIFTNKKEFDAFIRFCKNRFRSLSKSR